MAKSIYVGLDVHAETRGPLPKKWVRNIEAVLSGIAIAVDIKPSPPCHGGKRRRMPSPGLNLERTKREQEEQTPAGNQPVIPCRRDLGQVEQGTPRE